MTAVSAVVYKPAYDKTKQESCQSRKTDGADATPVSKKRRSHEKGSPLKRTRKAINGAVFTTSVQKADLNGETLLFGFAAVTTLNGLAYTDLQGDHIPEDVMLAAVDDFAKYSNGLTLYEHQGRRVGDARHSFPLTATIAEELGIKSSRTGFLLGTAIDKAMVDLYDIGKINAFSIGGMISYEDDKVVGLWIDEVSLVEYPAQEPATIDARLGDNVDMGFGDTQKSTNVVSFTRYRQDSLKNGEKDERAVDSTKTAPYTHPESIGETPMTEAEKKALEDAQKAAKEAEAKADELQKQLDAKNTEGDAEETEKAAPKVVYKSIEGDSYTDADDARVVKLAKANDEKELRIRKAEVPSVAEDVVEAVVRSGSEDAWKALVKQHEGNATMQKSRTLPLSTDSAPNADSVEAVEKDAQELAKSQGIPIQFARVEAAAKAAFRQEKEAA